MEFSAGKNVHQTCRKLWPAIMIAEGALDEDDFTLLVNSEEVTPKYVCDSVK